MNQKPSPLHRASEWIVDHYRLFFVVFAALLVFSAVASGWVKVENDVAAYLPADSETRQGLAERFYIASAATSCEEIGNDVYPPARAELRAHGVPVGHRAAVQVTPRDYDAYDWLLTMDENNARNLGRILPHDPDGKIRPLLSFAGEQRGIADPWYTDDFGAAYADIVRGCTAFLEHLRRSGDV